MELVELQTGEQVAVLTLNRPEARNALSIELCKEIVQALDSISTDSVARALVIKGKGNAFCSGADFAAVSGAGGLDFLPAFEDMLEHVARFKLPTIAAIQGAALGGGFQLACVCDFRICASDAKIGIPASRLGILVNFENVQRLVLLAGVARAKEILMTGKQYSGAEAARAGLVSKDVPAGTLDVEAERFAADLAERSPLSVQGTKSAIQTVLDHLSGARNHTPHAVDEIDKLVAQAYNSQDLQEGLAAMSERRSPKFEGR